MQDSLANFRIQIRRSKLFPLLAERGNPRFILSTKLLFEFLANSLRQRGALTSGRDCDLQVSAAHNRRVIKVAIGWIIDRVAEDAFRVSFGENLCVHLM